MLNSVPGFVVPHGHYRGAYPDTVTRAGARHTFEVEDDTQVLLFIGQVRPYKNVDRLLREFRVIPNPKLRLIVAGLAPDPDYRRQLLALAGADARILMRLEFIPPDEIQRYLRSADLVVLPYRDILNSGAALLALSFDVPVLVPKKGALGELQETIGQQWVRLYEDDLSQGDLQLGLAWAAKPHSDCEVAELRERLEEFSWSKLAAATISAYQQITRPETSRDRHL